MAPDLQANLYANVGGLVIGQRCSQRQGPGAALDNMKILAEGGTLPPRPARGGGRERDRGINSWALADGFGELGRVKMGLPNDHSAVNQLDIF
jgi:hypothetical protein